MKILSAELERIATKPDQYPDPALPEIAFVGRSNVGKSSLLNYLVSRRSLARVSGSPGKTRTINFYLINGSFRFVDLPGYGYARAPRSETRGWERMMSSYFDTRENLIAVCQLVDIRHDPTALDIRMHDFLVSYGLEGLICATKADKVSNSEKQKSLAMIRRSLSLSGEDRVIAVSALKRRGGEELLTELERRLAAFTAGIRP